MKKFIIFLIILLSGMMTISGCAITKPHENCLPSEYIKGQPLYRDLTLLEFIADTFRVELKPSMIGWEKIALPQLEQDTNILAATYQQPGFIWLSFHKNNGDSGVYRVDTDTNMVEMFPVVDNNQPILIKSFLVRSNDEVWGIASSKQYDQEFLVKFSEMENKFIVVQDLSDYFMGEHQIGVSDWDELGDDKLLLSIGQKLYVYNIAENDIQPFVVLKEQLPGYEFEVSGGEIWVISLDRKSVTRINLNTGTIELVSSMPLDEVSDTRNLLLDDSGRLWLDEAGYYDIIHGHWYDLPTEYEFFRSVYAGLDKGEITYQYEKPNDLAFEPPDRLWFMGSAGSISYDITRNTYCKTSSSYDNIIIGIGEVWMINGNDHKLYQYLP